MTESRTDRLRRLDKQHIWHPFTPMQLWLDSDPLVIVAAEGMHLIDSDGNRYLDGVSSLWCNVHGHRVPEIDNAIRAQLDKVAHTTMLGLASEPAIELADRLMRIVPSNLKKIFYSDAGATATEIALKLAAQYWYNIGKPEKCEFVGFAEAYHGDTVGAMSVGRTELFHRPYFPLLFMTHFVQIPWHGLPARESNSGTRASSPCHDLETLLIQRADHIAAICIEPLVQGAAGMLMQPHGYLAEVRRLATQYNVLLICDEVATGFGRTGKMFAVQHENVQPDLMCVAKGITGGYLPLAATFATQEIFDAFLPKTGVLTSVSTSAQQFPDTSKTFFHGHTYTGNPLACAAALASLDLFEKNNLLEQVNEKAQQLSQLLRPLLDLKIVKEIRQKGLMLGIELQGFDPRARTGHRICNNLRKRGIILRPLANTIVLMPPLAMPMTDLATIAQALHAELSSLQS